MHMVIFVFQLMEDHVDDSVTTGDYHSNSEAMNVEPVSETVENVTEDSINKKCEAPRHLVSTPMLFCLSPLLTFFYWKISQILEISSKFSF